MSIGYNPSATTTGLVYCVDAANLRSYIGSGTQWNNIGSQLGLTSPGNATLVGTPTYSSTNLGFFNFDAVDDYADSTITPSGLTGTGSWTMEAWFKVNGAPSNTLWFNAIVDTDATGGSGNLIAVDWGGYLGGSQNQLTYSTRPSTGGSYTHLYGPVLTQGVWYQAVVVRNGSTNTKLYTNGVLQSTYTGNMPTATQPLVRIGRWTDGTLYSNVSISVIKIYSQIISDADVTQNFNATRGRYGI